MQILLTICDINLTKESSQQTNKCSKPRIKALGKGVDYVQN